MTKMTNEMRSYFEDLADTFIAPAQNNRLSDINVVISGGCIRDTVLGKPVKDIDIFISYREVEDYLSLFGKTIKDCKTTFYWEGKKERQDYENVDIVGTYELTISNDFNDFEVNIIAMNANYSREQICNRHAFGICRCALDKDGFYFSPEFKKDFRNKTMTLFRTEWGLEQTMRYFFRLYPKLKMPMVLQDDFK